jgi:ATP-dependent helicase/DNAse subunit B
VPLGLLVGPANAGKVASLLDRYVAALDRGPFLVVPNRGEIEPIERDLLRRAPGLLGGGIGTFDDLFDRVLRLASTGSDARPVLTRTQRALLLTRVLGQAELGALAASSRFGGFASALGDAVSELSAALVEPAEVGSELGGLYRAYCDELERLRVRDADGVRGHAARLVASELAAWDGAPVFLYGFEDLTGAQWALLEALAGRTDVCVSLPYEPGRTAFAAVERTAGDLAALAGPRIEELAARGWYESPVLAGLERALFDERGAEAVALDGSVRFLEAAGPRASLELVGAEILELLRSGLPADEIGVIVPSIDSRRAPLETAFGSLGVPYAVEGSLRVSRTPFGRALLGLLRFAHARGGRSDLYAFLRTPYSRLSRARVDRVEGRLRGRAVSAPDRVEAETVRLLGQPLAALDALREASGVTAAIRGVAREMLRAAWGLERPSLEEAAALDLRVEEAVQRALDEIDGWVALGGDVDAEQVTVALGQLTVPTRARDRDRVVVLDLSRARTRRFRVVFVLGLEEGVLPRRAVEPPFLPESRRRELEQRRGSGTRLVRADPLARDRYLFYTACTRAWRRLYLVREAATDDGRPLEPSPFWEEVRSRFDADDVRRFTRRRALSALAWELHLAPTERERLRSVAAIGASDERHARALASAGGWSRQLERALGAFRRETRLVSPAVLRELGETTRFSATELERFVDCSSMWFVERLLDPKTIDPTVDARIRGIVAHQTLRSFYAGLPKRFGTDTIDPGRFDETVEYLRECLQDAIAGQVRLELPEVDVLELEGSLARDLELFLRSEVELGLPLVPRRFEVSFGTSRSAPELQRGLELPGLTVSGKIDRVDGDLFSASGIVHDYKSGEAFTARKIASEKRLQMPLYVLALRDLLGVEPLGGLYRSLSGEREARGMVRAESRETVPGLNPRDYLDEEAFWGQVDDAVELAGAAAERIRSGDVRHDPRFGSCPSWCESWTICRVRRS